MIMEQSEKKLFIVNFETVNKESKEVKLHAECKYKAEKAALKIFRNEQPNRLAYNARLFSAQLFFF
jgi:hypothetical protein